MRFCNRCGRGNQDQAAFCSGCGNPLSDGESGQGYDSGDLPRPGFSQYPVPLPNDSLAVTSLVMGIAAFFVCPLVLGVLAIVFGGRARRNIQQSHGMLAGDSFARAGVILGWINVGLVILIGIIVLVAVILATSSGARCMVA